MEKGKKSVDREVMSVTRVIKVPKVQKLRMEGLCGSVPLVVLLRPPVSPPVAVFVPLPSAALGFPAGWPDRCSLLRFSRKQYRAEVRKCFSYKL